MVFICLPAKTKNFLIQSSQPEIIDMLILVYGRYCCLINHNHRESIIINVMKRYDGLYDIICDSPNITYMKITKDPIQEIKKIILENPFSSPSVMVFHGAAVKRNKGAYVFLAPTHGGKTTLTSFLLNKGYCYISEDCTIVDMQDLHIIPCVTPIHLRPGGVKVLEEYGIFNNYPVIQTENVERYIYFPKLASQTNESIDGIFFLGRTTTTNKVQGLSKTQCIDFLLKSLMYPPQFNSRLFSFLNRLSGINTFSLSYCDMEYVDNILRQL